jgi:hypothetical protein
LLNALLRFFILISLFSQSSVLTTLYPQIVLLRPALTSAGCTDLPP